MKRDVVRFKRINPRLALTLLVLLVINSISLSQNISSISPGSGWQGQSLNLTISGTSLNFVQGTSTMVWLQQNANIIQAQVGSVQSSTVSANVSLPSGASTGLYDVHIGQGGISGVSLQDGFEVLTALPLLSGPVLTAPANSAIVSSNPVSFSWSAVSGASLYQYQVSRSAVFQGIEEQGVTPTTNVGLMLTNDDYYWRVRTRNAAGLYGNWSSVYQFTVEMPTSINSISPNSGYQGQSLPVTISGTNVSFETSTPVTWFELQMGGNSMGLSVSGENQLNAPNVEFTGTGVLSIPSSIPTGVYDLVYTDPTNSIYSLPQSFTVLSALPAPAAVTLIEPINGALVNTVPVYFDWADLPNISQYRLQVSSDMAFTDILVDQSNITESQYNRSLSDGAFYWRVRARNLSGIWGSWSQPENFELSGASYITAMNPSSGYAGQTGINVTISGVNLPFEGSTTTMNELTLNQNAFQIDLDNEHLQYSTYGTAQLDVPLNAPLGYYGLVWEIAPYAPVALYNAFYVTEGNEIIGRVYVDMNQNQVYDAGDVACPYFQLEALPSATLVTTQSSGEYVCNVSSGSHTVNLQPMNYFTSFPSLHTATFVGSGSTDFGNDFALQPIAGMHDMNISIAAQQLRQGRNRKVYLTVSNAGAEVESGEYSLTFAPGMTVTSSSDPNYTVNGNTVSWNFSNLGLFEQRQVWVNLYTPVSFQVGQLVDFSAEVTDVSTDQTPADNIFLLENQVVASYDPNYKKVSPEGPISESFVSDGSYLTYTVHFQNTGNAEAIDVYVLDTISEFLDLSTFQFLGASHDRVVNMRDNRLMEFRFDNIHLPDSTTNEPESHGYFTFRIKPVPGFSNSDVIENTAYIYFDYNEPIITNTTQNWIPTGIDDERPKEIVQVSPNPSSGRFRIEMNGQGHIHLFDIHGRLIQSGTIDNSTDIDLSEYPAGTYFLSVITESATHSSRLIKY